MIQRKLCRKRAKEMYLREITRAIRNGTKFGQRIPRLTSNPKLLVGKCIGNRLSFSTSICCRNLDDQFKKQFEPSEEKNYALSNLYDDVEGSGQEGLEDVLEDDLEPDAALKFTSKHDGIIYVLYMPVYFC